MFMECYERHYQRRFEPISAEPPDSPPADPLDVVVDSIMEAIAESPVDPDQRRAKLRETLRRWHDEGKK